MVTPSSYFSRLCVHQQPHHWKFPSFGERTVNIGQSRWGVSRDRGIGGVRRGAGKAGFGLGRSAQQHLIVNKRGVSSHADRVTAGNKRAIRIRWLSPYLRDQSPVTPPPPHPRCHRHCVPRRNGTHTSTQTSEVTCPSLSAIRPGRVAR